MVGFDIEVYDPLYSRLHDGLGAVRTGIERNVDGRALQVATERVVNGVPLGMHYVGVLGILGVHVVLVGPKLRIGIVESDRKAVVSDADDLLIGIYDAGTVLGLGVFRPERGEKGDREEIGVPAHEFLFAHRVGG